MIGRRAFFTLVGGAAAPWPIGACAARADWIAPVRLASPAAPTGCRRKRDAHEQRRRGDASDERHDHRNAPRRPILRPSPVSAKQRGSTSKPKIARRSDYQPIRERQSAVLGCGRDRGPSGSHLPSFRHHYRLLGHPFHQRDFMKWALLDHGQCCCIKFLPPFVTSGLI
jgi:hypothetical protein